MGILCGGSLFFSGQGLHTPVEGIDFVLAGNPRTLPVKVLAKITKSLAAQVIERAVAAFLYDCLLYTSDAADE